MTRATYTGLSAGDIVRAIRTGLGISGEQAAELSGLSRSGYYRREEETASVGVCLSTLEALTGRQWAIVSTDRVVIALLADEALRRLQGPERGPVGWQTTCRYCHCTSTESHACPSCGTPWVAA